ncbi:MAG: polymerase sigma factor FliA [Clostridia bacterium]|nr:polymerase sigma factor FliA [Clostridia bacterium]
MAVNELNGSNAQELVLQYLPLVRYIVSRLVVNPPPYLDQEDLLSYGIIGLLEALQRYEPGRGVKFSSFAAQRIRGAVLDALRQAYWAPRTLISELRRVSNIYRHLEQVYGEEVPDEAVASAAGLKVSELQELLSRGSQMAVLSLEEFLSDAGEEGARRLDFLADRNSPNPEQQYEEKEFRADLKKALARLPERDRLVLTLYYYEGLTLKEIGRVLNITESRVCQLHGRALLRLRRYLMEGE